MLDGSGLEDRAIQQLSDPPLSAIRPMLTAKWSKHIRDANLRRGLLSNDRVEKRIVTHMTRDIPQIDAEKLRASADFMPIVTLMFLGEDRVTKALSIAWHRATILEWLTWNVMTQRMPDVTLDEAKAAIGAVTPETILSAAMPEKPMPDMPLDMMRRAGGALLRVWMAGLPIVYARRLSLFVDIGTSKADAGKSQLVQDVSGMLLAREG